MNWLKKTVSNFATTSVANPTKFWNGFAMVTITSYHLSQILITKINKKIPKEQKDFLIPQEIIDGVVNLATFVVLSKGFYKLGLALLKKGIVKPSKYENFNQDKFKKGFLFATNLTGSLCAINIASPIIRNKYAANIQKKRNPEMYKTQSRTNIYSNKALFKV